ncbi:hypothetical protein DH2020_030090 [Rehmannia glutinosa]|uniref:Reverse transcriptase zinc-binding domain-containing protein n=1 Tax=Rehmannia glutinosa TaxID=99300 RepID=A0ABR0VP98_REHGL
MEYLRNQFWGARAPGFDDADLILNTPISVCGSKDRIVWHFDMKGKFSVHNAYEAVQHRRRHEADAPESSDNRILGEIVWRKTWKLKIKEKLKHFIWRCWFKHLATHYQINKKGMNIDSICDFCGENEETLEHIFFSCSRAQFVWKLAPVSWDGLSMVQNSFEGWWQQVCTAPIKDVAEDRIQLTIYILWWLWKARNLWVFQRSKLTEKVIVECAVNEWMEYKNVVFVSPKTPKSVIPGKCSSVNELSCGNIVGLVSCEVSACVTKEKSGGLGGVLRDECGNCIMAWSSFRDRTLGPVEAILLAVRHALVVASRVQQNKIRISIDVKEIARKLEHGLEFDAANMTIAEDIYVLKNLFWNAKWPLLEYGVQNITKFRTSLNSNPWNGYKVRGLTDNLELELELAIRLGQARSVMARQAREKIGLGRATIFMAQDRVVYFVSDQAS